MAKYRNSILEYWTSTPGVLTRHNPSNWISPRDSRASCPIHVLPNDCPVWCRVVARAALLQPPSASAERVFSPLKLFFQGARATTLHDQVEASLMAAFNKRQPRLVSAQNAAVLGGAEAGAGPRPRVQGQRHDTCTRVPGHEPCRPPPAPAPARPKNPRRACACPSASTRTW